MSQYRSKLLGFLAVVIGASLCAALLLKTDFLSEIENRTWDWRIKLTVNPEDADRSIKIIMIDQSSLEFFANEESIFWPWPRGMYEAVVKFLHAAHARGVAFDVIFSEQSSYGVDDDEALAESFKVELPVVSAVALRRSAVSDREFDFGVFKEKILSQPELVEASKRYILDETEAPNGSFYSAITLPVLPLLRATDALGNVTAQPDSDGIYRHARTGEYLQGVPILGLAFSLFEAGKRDLDYAPQPKKFFDHDGLLTVNFHGPARTYQTYRMSSVIQSLRQLENGEKPAISPDVFKDSWVFIGMDAPGLLDLRPTPLSELYPGVEFHATVLDNLLHDNFALKASFILNLLFSVMLVGISCGAVLFLPELRLQAEALLIIAISAFLFWYYTAFYGMWFSATVPSISALIAVLAGLSYQYQLEGRQHRFIKNAFKYYVSPELIEEIVKDPSSLSLGGARRELTIFFSDLAGFTTISESIDPQRLVTLLNRYLSEMTDIILASGGTLDKYEGDAIIAFWNAPLATEDHAKRAVLAARACQKKLDEMRPGLEAEFGVSLHMRIGMNTGSANVGNFGSKERFNYTVIGDAANLAARLEGVNKVFGTALLFPQSTKDQLGDAVLCRKIADLKVVGKTVATTVYEPVEDGFDLDSYMEALALYESGKLEEALVHFERLHPDPVAAAYIGKIREDIEQLKTGTFEPVWSLSSK